MYSYDFWLEDAKDVREPFLFQISGEYARIKWEGGASPDASDNPEVMMEVYEGQVHARIYHPHHDEPLVSIVFGPDGRVTDMVVRRSPALPLTFEDVTPIEPAA